jgi:transposase
VAQDQFISQMGVWDGYDVESCVTEVPRDASWCIVCLSVQEGRERCCSGCLRPCREIHDLEPRRIPDLPVFEHRTVILFPRVRVVCPHCGPRVEKLAWLDPYARVTCRMGESVARLC